MPTQVHKKVLTSKQRARRKERPARREIARRAYEIFVGRGGSDGHDLEDWLQAETELISRRN